MINYTLRRFAIMIPMIILLSIVIFFIINLPPGDYVSSLLIQLENDGEEVSAELAENLRERYGLDQPFILRYQGWATGLLRGEMGVSFLYEGLAVRDILRIYMPFTILIATATQIFILLIGIPLGIFSAVNQYKFSDNLLTFIGFIGLSIPNFLLALVLMYFSLVFFENPVVGGLFSAEFAEAPWSIYKVIDLLRNLWIPVLVLGTAGSASILRIMRGNLLDILNMQFIKTARSKGLSERIVIFKHAARNAAHPIIMRIGMRMPQLLSGSTIVSIVLGLPTLGPILFRALRMQDMYLAGTILLFQCILLQLGNLVADLGLAWLDPRIKFD